MLARTFKTADELRITDAEHKALHRLLEEMEKPGFGVITEKSFDMACVWNEFNCGAVGCLMGWARHLVGEWQNKSELFRFRGDASPITMLFYPWRQVGEDVDPSDFTREQGLTALRNYLTTGNPHWHSVLNPL